MDETQNPLESGLTWTLDHHDPSRQYIGRSALDSMQPARHLSGLLLLDKGVLRAHQKIITAHGDGETTSGGFAPTLNRSIALARLPLAIKNGDAVHVEIRGKLHNAMVVKPPFVRHGKVLVCADTPSQPH